MASAALLVASLLFFWPAAREMQAASMLCLVALCWETRRLLQRAAAFRGTLRLREHGELQWRDVCWQPQGKPLMFSWGLFWRLRSEHGRRRGLWLMRDAVSEAEWRHWRREVRQ